MIVSKLFAQLGNQCFMISAAIAHAKRMGATYAFPKHSLDPRIWPTYFTLPIAKRTTRHYYKEPRHAYDPLPEYDDMTIEGYYQSEKYFSDAKPEIAKVLGFEYKPADYVAIHVRRGDYLKYPDQFPVLTDEYYFSALLHAQIRGHKKFRIFSDDIDHCKKKYGDIEFRLGIKIEFSTERDPVKDMRDMYNAKAFIIANSTFSLFPALLRQDSPLVIAPAESRWYGPANKTLETSDLMPERFIKI